MLLKSVRSRREAADAISDIFRREKPDHEFEVRRTLPVLEQHGTTLMQFKPEAIWNMAMTDLRKRHPNAIADVTSMHHYHFHRDHVRKAASANDILRAAIAEPAKGRESGKKITRLLYADVEQLKAALAQDGGGLRVLPAVLQRGPHPAAGRRKPDHA